MSHPARKVSFIEMDARTLAACGILVGMIASSGAIEAYGAWDKLPLAVWIGAGSLGWWALLRVVNRLRE